MRQILIPLALALLLTVGCGGRPRARQEQPVHVPEAFPAPVVSQLKPKSVAQQVAGQQGITAVRITDRGFEPTEIHTVQGGVVKIHLRNESRAEHNLVLDRFGIVSRTLAPGEENYIEFTATAKGSWPFLSDAPGQPEPTFRGLLKVE